MRKAMGVAVIFFSFFLQATPSYGENVQLPSIDANWLQTVNYYRQASGLSPIVEDTNLSAAVKKHITYLTQSDPKYFTGPYVSRHLENPRSPYYTRAGARSGQELTSTLTSEQSLSVDLWMAAPFHAIGFMREGLRKVGWSSGYNARTGFFDVGADVLDGLQIKHSKTITFPGNGSLSRMDNFQGESPDPRESCGAKSKSYQGLPIWVSLTSRPPRQMSAQIVSASGEVLSSPSQLCIVNEFNFKTSDSIYGSAGRAIVRYDHMVLIIPSNPLTPGLQKVSLALRGKSTISWSFTVIPRPPDITVSPMTNAAALSWQPTSPLDSNPIIGYEVLVGDATLKKIETFRTSGTTFPTKILSAGNYWVCVKAIGRYRSGDCPNFIPYSVTSGSANSQNSGSTGS